MSRKPDFAVAASALPSDKVEEIRAQLQRVLASQQFRSSRRCQNLLRHITEQTLAGDSSPLKERNLGVDVFGRDADYDTSQDPCVRATAAEIRKKLAQYYQETAHDGEPRIDLLSGSYVPVFHINGTIPPLPPEPDAETEATAPRRPWAFMLFPAAAVLIVVCIALVVRPFARSDLDRFWAPILQVHDNVIISLGQPTALNLRSSKAQDLIQLRRGMPQEMPGQMIAARDLVILADRYIALGDAECLVRIAGLFERRGKPYRIRGERTTSFADVRENPAVFIGAFDNAWTLRAGNQLRFIFEKDSDHDTDLVRDRQQPAKNDWKLTGAWPEWDISEDYAIVSRVLDANTDHPFVIAAGITHYGTMAAGEFMTNPEYLAEAVAQLPRDWAKRNVQIVLRVPVVHRAAGHPRVLATYVW